MVGGLPGNSFVFVEFEEGGGVFELAALAFPTVGLDVAEVLESFLELAREAVALDAEVGEEPVGVEDGEAVRVREKSGFEERDAIEAPGGVD